MDLKYWIGFNLVRGIGPARLRALLDHFGDLERAWKAEAEELKEAGLDQRSLESLLATRKMISLEEEVAKVARAGAEVIPWDDPSYPPRLAQIHNPPFLLYVKGEIVPQDEWAVAVVGTRTPRPYGRQVVEQIAGDLARNGITVVSGLARGIDSLAHQAALDAGGRTIAVLGCGIDIVYPTEYANLAKAIASNGALVTEYPLGTPPEGGNFPARNRIISGLALGTVIVEAGQRSGALITADYTLEQGRELFAVPGNITSEKSQGTNRLIQEGGAKLVLSVEDILEELNLSMIAEQREVQEVLPQNETEAIILKYVSQEPVHIDQIGRETGLPISQVSSTLALMELKGLVRQVGGMNYVLAREAKVRYLVD